MSQELEILRSRIDEIDSEILNLLNLRMSLAIQIGRTKAAQDKPTFDWQRERAILEKLSGLNTGPLRDSTLRAVFREIFSGSRSLQQALTVAYLGPPGTHTHEAALHYFGESIDYKPCGSLRMTFKELAVGRAHFAVVPIENSVEGSIRETLDLLLESNEKICGELGREIRHSLANQSGEIEDVKRVMSHPQALAQCREWLFSHLPDAGLEETLSTARATERALKDMEVAAVAGEKAATSMGLRVIQRDIQDSPDNVTKFLVLGQTSAPPSGNDRTSLVFWVKNRPGALSEILEIIAGFGIDLTKIESRPQKGSSAWEYAFFVDLMGHYEDSTIKACLTDMEKKAIRIKILGSYPIEDRAQRFPNHD